MQAVRRWHPTTGVPSSRLSHSMWVSWWAKRGLGRFLTGFLPFSPTTKISNHPNLPETLQALIDAAVEEWDNLPQEQLNTLVRSMPRRVVAYIGQHGGHFRYGRVSDTGNWCSVGVATFRSLVFWQLMWTLSAVEQVVKKKE